MNVPKRLQGVIGKTAFKRALGPDYNAACEDLDLLVVQAKADLKRARAVISKAQGSSSPINRTLSDRQIWELTSRWFVASEKAASELTVADVDVEERRIDLAWLSDSGDGTPGLVSAFATARRLLIESHIEIDEASPSIRRLALLLQEATIEHERRVIARFSGQPTSFNPKFGGLTAETKPEVSSEITLGDVVILAEREAEKSYLTGTPRANAAKRKRDGHFDLIRSFFGESMVLRSITRQDAVRFRDAVRELPSNYTKRFPKLSVLDVLALPQDQRQPLIKVATANPYIRAFSRLFDYAIQEQLFDGQHPATNLRLGGGGHSADDREPFKPDDLKRIFNAPIYRGCLNDGDGYAIAGLDKPRRSRFWVPLIALFTGTRLGEICQLRENDFTVIDGIDVFLLRHERMDLKTAASARPVPVHPELKRIGLLRFVEQRRRDAGTGALIFPEITVGSNGYASENYSKWFRRFLISVGAKRAATSFHSFRHSFADAGIDAGLMREEIDWIGGWANKTTSQKYGGSVETKTRKLAPLINRIAYRGLDLSHLHEAVGGQE